MKKFSPISFLLMVALASSAQKNASTVTITGDVTGDTKGSNYIYYYASGMPVDSVLITNGKFEIRLPFTSTYTQLFYTQYEMRQNHGYRPFAVLVDQPGSIHIDMKIDEGFFGSSISGSQTAALYNIFLKQQTDVYKKINPALEKLYGASWYQRNRPDAASINVSRDSLVKLYTGTMVANFVKKNPDAFASAYALGMAKYSMDMPDLENAFGLLSPQMQKSKEGEQIAAFMRGMKNAVAGKTIQNFALTDDKGKEFNFAQWKGKYVWIDFWASWCGPCKAAFPHMRELYSKYKTKNLEILGISTDETKEPWLAAVNKIKNPWLQLWDNKTVASEFAVAAYPTSFLIGPDGKIILKEVGFEPGGEMEKKLAELFGK